MLKEKLIKLTKLNSQTTPNYLIKNTISDFGRSKKEKLLKRKTMVIKEKISKLSFQRTMQISAIGTKCQVTPVALRGLLSNT